VQTGGAENTKNNNNLNRKISNVLENSNVTQDEQKRLANNTNNNNKDNNIMGNEDVKTIDVSSVNKNVNTRALKPTDTLLDKFREFIQYYTKIDSIDPKIIELVDTAFKTHDKFSNEIQVESELRIREEDFDNFCINNVNDNSQIPITLNDPRLTDYLKIYKDLKALYLDNCEYLLNLLEKQVLVKEKVNETDANPHFTLKELTYTELSKLETDVRNRLVNMYSQCQKNYQAGIKALYLALRETTSLTE